MRRMQQFADGTRLAELLALVAVAEELSFTRAGVRLGRDATVLSRRIRALEARLGVRLLERTTRAVAPTEAGSAYLERARSSWRRWTTRTTPRVSSMAVNRGATPAWRFPAPSGGCGSPRLSWISSWPILA